MPIRWRQLTIAGNSPASRATNISMTPSIRPGPDGCEEKGPARGMDPPAEVKFEARIRELVENQPDLAVLVEPTLIVRRVLREQIVILHRRLLAIVRDDEVCRRLMTTPGVGPVGVADLSRHRRRARSLPQVQVRRGSVRADVRQVSIGRDRSERQNIPLRTR